MDAKEMSLCNTPQQMSAYKKDRLAWNYVL